MKSLICVLHEWMMEYDGRRDKFFQVKSLTRLDVIAADHLDSNDLILKYSRLERSLPGNNTVEKFEKFIEDDSYDEQMFSQLSSDVSLSSGRGCPVGGKSVLSIMPASALSKYFADVQRNTAGILVCEHTSGVKRGTFNARCSVCFTRNLLVDFLNAVAHASTSAPVHRNISKSILGQKFTAALPRYFRVCLMSC